MKYTQRSAAYAAGGALSKVVGVLSIALAVGCSSDPGSSSGGAGGGGGGGGTPTTGPGGTTTPPSGGLGASCDTLKAMGELAAKGKSASFVADYTWVCQTGTCKKNPPKPRYQREYYAAGQDRIDEFADEARVLKAFSTSAYLKMPDENEMHCKAEQNAWSCTKTTIKMFSDTVEWDVPTVCLLKSATETTRTIAGESARCFAIVGVADTHTTRCFTSDGIMVYKQTDFSELAGERTVTKLTRTVDPSVFTLADGQTF